MPNIATLLKSEISRVARKEVRIEAAPIKKASTQHRSDIALHKRRVAALEALVKRSTRKSAAKGIDDPAEETGPILCFRGTGLHSQRKRLGLSAVQMALLLGVSNQSVSNWEQGKARPRASQLPAIAAVRKMSKTAAAETLSALGA